jgi:hypothetical protein
LKINENPFLPEKLNQYGAQFKYACAPKKAPGYKRGISRSSSGIDHQDLTGLEVLAYSFPFFSQAEAFCGSVPRLL